MKFGHIELETADAVASMRFYVDVLGYTLVANHGDQFIWVEKGGVEYKDLVGQVRELASRRVNTQSSSS